MTTTSDTTDTVDTQSRVPEYEPGPLDWAHLDRDTAAQLWEELFDWVDWLRARYELGGRLLPCWYRHSPLVEELTALMGAHRAAYATTATEDDPAERWHDGPASWQHYTLRPFIDRLDSVTDLEQCDLDRCGYRPLEIVSDRGGFAEYIAADVDGRPAPPPPPPPSSDDVDDSGATLTADEMAAAVQLGMAEPLDPADPGSAVHYEDQLWEWDADDQKYRGASPAPEQFRE